MTRALVLLSGGLDSAVALWWALREGHDVEALSFSYPGRPRNEARAAREVAESASVPLHEADLPFLFEPADALLHDASPLPDAPRGYIPARNALFYAAAAYHAEVLGCDIIVGGHNADDGARFPDATGPFFDRLERLLAEGLWRAADHRRPRLAMPLLHLSKRDVAAAGRAWGAPLPLAWSCYEDGDAPCGACPACVERDRVAFA